MKAAVFESFGGPISIETVADPSPGPGSVVVEVAANGVCRSDWHGWMGHDPSISLPHVPGHELAGTVVAVGEDVDFVDEGDRVTAPFVLGCGSCPRCQSGNQQVCDNQVQAGFTTWGSMAEYVELPYAQDNVVVLPDSMSFATAAGLGCRFATAFRAVVDQAGVGSGTTVAVWGCGGVGLSAVMIASALGATVIGIDISRTALSKASELGATHVIDASAEERPDRIVRELTDGGVDVSIDALGSTITARNSITCLRTQGRHIQVGLMIGDDAKPVIPMWRLHALEIELYGSHGMQAHRYPTMLDMIADGTLSPDSLVTSRLTLQEGVDLLMTMDTFPATGFAVIEF